MQISRLRRMADATPETRDRYVDFLRAFSIVTVVFGHYLIAIIVWDDGRISVQNAVGVTSGLWLLTWILQVMPLFFFVGGFSNLKTYDAMISRGSPHLDYLRARALRLWKPTLVFVAVWTVLQAALHVADIGRGGLIRGSSLPFGPLWFLFVYMFVVACVRFTLPLHRKFGLLVPVVLLGLVAVVDVLRFAGDVAYVEWVNLAAVWLFAHQLGYFYADRSLVRAGPQAHAGLAVAGFAGLVVLTNLGVYPRSMVGTDIERVSNMNPPTLCIVALTLWLVGLAMLLRGRVNRWLAQPGPWMTVIGANSIIMTVFLWHLTAYLVTILVLYPLGLGHPLDTTASWWLQRPLWLAAPAIVLTPLVLLLSRFERA